ncbi:MAG: exodeoxyribonuclease VII large subunit [Sutterella sp.]|nr:exodeoxyribonuclease VII large subunit [Sutterella sp.]
MPESSIFDDYPDYLFGEAPAVRRPASRCPERTPRTSSARPAGRPDVMPVSAAVEQLRGVVSNMLGGFWISGEVSNLSRPASGHVYFTLKDGEAQLRCVYFAMSARRHPAFFRIGEKIEVTGRADIYARGGELQLRISDWRLAGAGELYEAYLRLKSKLAAEGLFDAALKKRLPFFIRRAVVVTSPQAAALQDVIRAVSRRMPWVRLSLSPAFVQGAEAPESLIAALRLADRAGADAVLLVRGGGSFEDLMCFSDERLVRAIRAMKTPVLAGIGHESDETLASLAADVCASTPTAAAEHLGRDAGWWHSLLTGFEQQLEAGLERRLGDAEQSLDAAQRRLEPFADVPLRFASRLSRSGALLEKLASALLAEADERLGRAGRTLVSPEAALEAKSRRLENASAALTSALSRTMRLRGDELIRSASRLEAAVLGSVSFQAGRLHAAERHLPAPGTLLLPAVRRLEAASHALSALDPDRPLRQGYVRVERAGLAVTSAAEALPGDAVELVFADGRRTADIRQ